MMGKYSAGHTKDILTAVLQNWEKLAVKKSMEKLRYFISCICLQYFVQGRT